MTQPVQEQTTERDVGGLGWRTSQLARRPPPSMGGGSSWGVPDLILSAGADQVEGDAHYPVPWADFATPHSVVAPGPPIEISDADGDLFFLTITDDGSPNPGNDRYEVETRREGWWASHMITQWDQVGTAGEAGREIASVMQRIFWTSSTGIAFSPTEFRSSSDWMIADSYDGGALVINSFGFMDDSYLSTIIMPHYLPSGKTWQATGLHRTGNTGASERGLSGVMWKFWFIEEDDLDAWTFGNVFD